MSQIPGKVRIATRESALAMTQAQMVRSALLERYPGLEVEIINLTLRLAAAGAEATRCADQPADKPAAPVGRTRLFDPGELAFREVPVYWRFDLSPGSVIPGPAVIAEDETSTFVTAGFVARINPLGYIVLTLV